jgi:hypothetical protein
MVAKSFPQKQVCTKHFHQKFLVRKFFMVAKSFTSKQVLPKYYHQKYFGRNFL